MKAGRRLAGWPDRHPAWWYALTRATFYFVLLVIIGVPLQLWVQGHLELSYLLPLAALFAVGVTARLTLRR